MQQQRSAKENVKSRGLVSSDMPFLADWVVITLRWAGMLAAILVLAATNRLTLVGGAVLTIMALWNISMSVFALVNIRMTQHRPLNVITDVILAGLLFAVTQGMAGPLFWIGFIPFCTWSIYYELSGALLGGVLFSSAQAAWIYVQTGLPGLMHWAAIATLLGNLLLALALGLVSRVVMRRLRRNYQGLIRKRQETVQRAQKQERDRMQTFYKMIETLSATLNYELVLNTALDLCLNALADSGEVTPYIQQTVSAVLLFGEHDLVIASARRFPPPDMRQTFAGEQGTLARAIQSAEPVLTPNPSTDPELGRLVCLRACRTALVLPLRRGLDSFGMILFAHADPGFFTSARIEVLEMISHQMVISIQNARLYQEMAEEQQRIVKTQEDAQKKLARELHDGPTQSVAAIAMRVNLVRTLLDMDAQTNLPEAKTELARVEDLARRTTQEIRHMLFTLRPLVLEGEGLEAALEQTAAKFHDTFQQDMKVEVDPELIKRLDKNKQTVIFFLVEEASNNARKYAKASLIHIWLGYTADHSIALLQIADNGVGFDVKQVTMGYERRGSLGMVNLRERTQLINGLLNLDSAPGKGTRVQVFIPLDDAAADRLQRGLIPAF